MVLGEPIFVVRDAGDAGLAAARRTVEEELDRVHARAYALIGATDPGAALKARRRAGSAQESAA
jgi:hypothetical protein